MFEDDGLDLSSGSDFDDDDDPDKIEVPGMSEFIHNCSNYLLKTTENQLLISRSYDFH